MVVIGGGTGSFALLSGLKDYVQDITALVNMADDGGSAGQLRDQLGVLPPATCGNAWWRSAIAQRFATYLITGLTKAR